MSTSQNFTNHLAELTVASVNARDLGYFHTAHALDMMREVEISRLRGSLQQLSGSSVPASQTVED